MGAVTYEAPATTTLAATTHAAPTTTYTAPTAHHGHAHHDHHKHHHDHHKHHAAPAATYAAPAVTYTAGAAPACGVQYVTFQGKQLPHFHETHLQTQHPILLREHANLLYSTIGHATLGRAVPIHDHELIEFILWCQEMHLTPLLLIGGLSA